ncbi:MAG TPA: hypothetical protein VGE66_07685 [Chitinophagaceae bacterium]
MRRVGRILQWVLIVTVMACNNEKKEEAENETEFRYETFSGRFKDAKLPYSLTDTGLLKNEDTAAIRNQKFISFIPDSINKKLFPNPSKVRYIPLARVAAANGEQYFILKAVSGSRKAALLVTFDQTQNYGAALPFLVPDNEAKSSQVSSLDKAFSITRSVSRRDKDDVLMEGKDVYVYNKDARQFTLIMTDLLDEGEMEVINPIDTFARTHRYAGDYTQGKRSILSIRDGRSDKEVQFFVHFEKNDGECTGELKGTLFFTSTTTAVYRQGGDPCVLEFDFKKSSVSMREVEGCGLHRGLQCLFEGTFTRKKETPVKGERASKKDKVD